MSPPKSLLHNLLFAVAVLTTLVAFRALYFYAPSLFYDPGDLIYKWFALPAAALVLFHDRSRLALEIRPPAAGGLVAFIVFGLVGFIGKHGQQLRFEIIALVGQLLALAWSFYGSRSALRLIFPVLAAVTCLPVEAFLDFGRTKELSAFILPPVAATLECCGVETLLNGLELQVPSAGLTIYGNSPDCSVIALFASFLLVLTLASLRITSVPLRLAVIAISFPLALVANTLRTLTVIAARINDADRLANFLCLETAATWFILAIVGGCSAIAVGLLVKGESPCART